METSCPIRGHRAVAKIQCQDDIKTLLYQKCQSQYHHNMELKVLKSLLIYRDDITFDMETSHCTLLTRSVRVDEAIELKTIYCIISKVKYTTNYQN